MHSIWPQLISGEHIITVLSSTGLRDHIWICHFICNGLKPVCRLLLRTSQCLKDFGKQNLKQIFGPGCFQKYDYCLLTLKFWPAIVWNYVLPHLSGPNVIGLNVSRFIASIFSKINNVVGPHFLLTFRHKESTVNRLQLQISWPCPKRDRDWSIPTLRRWPLTWVIWATALQGCVLYIWMSGACALPKN